MNRVWIQTRPGDPIKSALVREVPGSRILGVVSAGVAVAGCCAVMMGVLLGLAL